MWETKPLKLRAADLRRMAATTPDAERERKMLVLAEVFEEAERAQDDREPDHREGD